MCTVGACRCFSNFGQTCANFPALEHECTSKHLGGLSSPIHLHQARSLFIDSIDRTGTGKRRATSDVCPPVGAAIAGGVANMDIASEPFISDDVSGPRAENTVWRCPCVGLRFGLSRLRRLWEPDRPYQLQGRFEARLGDPAPKTGSPWRSGPQNRRGRSTPKLNFTLGPPPCLESSRTFVVMGALCNPRVPIMASPSSRR